MYCTQKSAFPSPPLVFVRKLLHALSLFYALGTPVHVLMIIMLSLCFVQDFREQLIRQLEPVFPEEIQAYVAVSEFSKKEQR